MSLLRVVVAVVAVAVVGAGLWALRAATISRDVPAAAGTRTEVVYTVATRHLDEHSVEEAASALFDACRLTVEATVAQPPVAVDDDTFRAVFEPALDRTDRLQLRGCIEDLQLAHVLGDVLRIGRVEQRTPVDRS